MFIGGLFAAAVVAICGIACHDCRPGAFEAFDALATHVPTNAALQTYGACCDSEYHTGRCVYILSTNSTYDHLMVL